MESDLQRFLAVVVSTAFAVILSAAAAAVGATAPTAPTQAGWPGGGSDAPALLDGDTGAVGREASGYPAANQPSSVAVGDSSGDILGGGDAPEESRATDASQSAAAVQGPSDTWTLGIGLGILLLGFSGLLAVHRRRWRVREPQQEGPESGRHVRDVLRAQRSVLARTFPWLPLPGPAEPGQATPAAATGRSHPREGPPASGIVERQPVKGGFR